MAAPLNEDIDENAKECADQRPQDPCDRTSFDKIHSLANRPSSLRMSTALRIIQIGNEAGVVLPGDLVARWALQAGDDVVLTRTDDGIRLEFIGKPIEDAGDEKP